VRDVALGQIFFYMGWAGQHSRRGRIRGIVVTYEIAAELATAVRRAQEVFAVKVQPKCHRGTGRTLRGSEWR
jgi:hypothetical protein